MCVKGILQLFTSFYLHRKFSLFLMNDRVCTRRKFPMHKEKFWIQQKKSYKINFPATAKKNDTTAQLYCTLSTFVTTKTISRQNQKNLHNTTTVWNSKYIVVCTTKTYFLPEQKTDKTAQLEKRFLQPTQSKCLRP